MELSLKVVVYVVSNCCIAGPILLFGFRVHSPELMSASFNPFFLPTPIISTLMNTALGVPSRFGRQSAGPRPAPQARAKVKFIWIQTGALRGWAEVRFDMIRLRPGNRRRLRSKPGRYRISLLQTGLWESGPNSDSCTSKLTFR